jgi:hypothetical protein
MNSWALIDRSLFTDTCFHVIGGMVADPLFASYSSFIILEETEWSSCHSLEYRHDTPLRVCQKTRLSPDRRLQRDLFQSNSTVPASRRTLNNWKATQNIYNMSAEPLSVWEVWTRRGINAASVATSLGFYTAKKTTQMGVRCFSTKSS